MGKVEKSRYHKFYILNVKLRKKNSNEDLEPDDYVRIFKKLYRKKIHAESSRGKHCIIRFLFEEKEKNEVLYMHGSFAQFTYIENKNWFSLEKLDLDIEFKLPDGLFPDAVITDFVFIPKAHRFCFRIISGVSVSPYPIKKFLEYAFDKVTDQNEYIQVDVETDVSTIEMFMTSFIKKISININYSNVDTSDDLKKFVEEDIKSSNTSKLEITATQKPDSSIIIRESKILTGALEAAISNGDATATIIDENQNVQTVSTESFPRIERVLGVATNFSYLVYQKIMEIFRPNND